jgi:hypothetical protein
MVVRRPRTHTRILPKKKEEEENNREKGWTNLQQRTMQSSKGMMFGHQFKPKKKTQKGLHPPAPSSQDNDLLMHVNAGSISSF